MAGSIFAISGTATAGIIQYDDPGIFSPFDNAQAEVVWVGSSAGYTGNLDWVNPDLESPDTTLWTNKSAKVDQRFMIPMLYSEGQRVDFTYEIIRGRKDAFSTADISDWGQFRVDSTDPLDVLVGIEDIRLPRGDSDYNDSVFRVVFSQAVVPAPGAYALIGGGCLLMSRRRRR